MKPARGGGGAARRQLRGFDLWAQRREPRQHAQKPRRLLAVAGSSRPPAQPGGLPAPPVQHPGPRSSRCHPGASPSAFSGRTVRKWSIAVEGSGTVCA